MKYQILLFCILIGYVGNTVVQVYTEVNINVGDTLVEKSK